MFKKLLISGVILCLLAFNGQAQSPASWQRLHVHLASTYYNAVRENQVGLDSSLIYVSQTLRLSRLLIIGDGIEDPPLLAQCHWVDQRNPGEGVRLLSRLTGKQHLEMLILLGGFYAFEPTNRDSAQYFLDLAIAESKDRHDKDLALCLLGKVYVQGANSVRGDSIFNLLPKEGEMGAKALYYRALYTAFSPASILTRITWFQKAAEIYHRLDDTADEIDSWTDIGYLNVATFQLSGAYDAFMKAYQLAESSGFPYTQYNSDDLAMTTGFQGKFGEPLRFTLETITTAETNHDSIGLAVYYNRLGRLYEMEGGRNEEALKWMQKASDCFILARDPHLYLNLMDIVALMVYVGHADSSLTLIHDIAKKLPPISPSEYLWYYMALCYSYSDQHKFALAEQYLSKAKEVAKRSGGLIYSFRTEMFTEEAGVLYFAEGQYSKARPLLQEFLSGAEGGEANLDNLIHCCITLITIDSIFHDAPSGLIHYKRYAQLLDSNFTVTRVRQAEELDVKYQTQEKESQITVLNQQAKLEKSDLKQATLIKDVTFGGIALALIIVGLLVRQNKLRKRNNKVVSENNELLRHVVTEKEWLLREIHHRVKNNFQTVMGLLGTQSGYLKNDVAITAISDSQRRIQAMSLIHQRLYQTEDLSAINMPDYIHELVDYLNDSFNRGGSVRFKLNIEPIELHLSHCIPLGLILNEAITNAFKYAFPGDREGTISITFRAITDKRSILNIEDDGIGLPVGFDSLHQDSMGVNLMRGLSTEIGGTFTMQSQRGTKISITFPIDIDLATFIQQKPETTNAV